MSLTCSKVTDAFLSFANESAYLVVLNDVSEPSIGTNIFLISVLSFAIPALSKIHGDKSFVMESYQISGTPEIMTSSISVSSLKELSLDTNLRLKVELR